MNEADRLLLAAWEAERTRSGRMDHRAALAAVEALVGRSRMGSLLFETKVNRLGGQVPHVLCYVIATSHGQSLESLAVGPTWEVVLDKVAAAAADGRLDEKIRLAKVVSDGMRKVLDDTQGQRSPEIPEGI